MSLPLTVYSKLFIDDVMDFRDFSRLAGDPSELRSFGTRLWCFSRQSLIIFIFTGWICFLPHTTLATSVPVTYSAAWQAWAPNAGGQRAYALRRATPHSEISIFMNEYLLAGNNPLYGATYDWRLPICDRNCFWQFYVQMGAGISSGGVLGEILWSSTFLWVARLDIATQIFLSQQRLVTWSYPLWLGLSLPL